MTHPVRGMNTLLGVLCCKFYKLKVSVYVRLYRVYYEPKLRYGSMNRLLT